jgi:hypothetical protein
MSRTFPRPSAQVQPERPAPEPAPAAPEAPEPAPRPGIAWRLVVTLWMISFGLMLLYEVVGIVVAAIRRLF